jgi:hypothetical protein
MGMGDHAFWLNDIMFNERRCPSASMFLNNESLREALGPFVWNGSAREFFPRKETREAFDMLRAAGRERIDERFCTTTEGTMITRKVLASLNSEDFCDEASKTYGVTFQNNFTYDIVLQREHLREGLGLPNSDEQPNYGMIEQLIEEKLGLSGDLIEEELRRSGDPFHHYIVFDARKQKLRVVYGIENGMLRDYLDKQTDSELHACAIANLRNCFSMLTLDGADSGQVQLQGFHGMFTPQFFPRRFSLKDSIYGQRLDLLSYLLHHTLLRYSRCRPRVDYVEYSVGVGDMSREWIVDVLASLHSMAQAAEAAQALGLSPWKQTRLVILPQALRSVIPALVGQAISLYKDTTLVLIIGQIELLAVAQNVTQQEAFIGQGYIAETLVFVSLIYWVGSYWMSRESQRLEARLGVGTR